MGAFPVPPNASLLWERPACKCFRFRQFYLCGCPDRILPRGRHAEHALSLFRCEMWYQPACLQEMARRAGFRHKRNPPITKEPHVLPFPCYRHLMESRVYLPPSELRRRRRVVVDPKRNRAIAESRNRPIRTLQEFQKESSDWETRKRLREENDDSAQPPQRKRKYHPENEEVAGLRLQELNLQESRSQSEDRADRIMNEILRLQREELEYWRRASVFELETSRSPSLSEAQEITMSPAWSCGYISAQPASNPRPSPPSFDNEALRGATYLERIQRLEAIAHFVDDQRRRNEGPQVDSEVRQFVVPLSPSSSPPSSGSGSSIFSDEEAPANSSPTSTESESSADNSPQPSPQPSLRESSPPASYTTGLSQQHSPQAPRSSSPPAPPSQPQLPTASRAPPYDPSLWRIHTTPKTTPHHFSSLNWLLEEQSVDLWALDGYRSRCPLLPPPKEKRKDGLVTHHHFDGNTHTGYSRGAYKMDSDVLSEGWMRWDPDGSQGKWARVIVGDWFGKGGWSLGNSGYGFFLSME